ncbi:unnamed protein product [Lampetra fluviatilis]
MLTCVACFWCLLSLALLAACSLGLVSPAWLARTAASAASGGGSGGVAGAGGAGMVSLGLFGYCGGGPTPGSVPLGGPAGGGGSGPGQVATHACSTYGGRGRFGDIPSAAWQVSVVLCGAAARCWPSARCSPCSASCCPRGRASGARARSRGARSPPQIELRVTRLMVALLQHVPQHSRAAPAGAAPRISDARAVV